MVARISVQGCGSPPATAGPSAPRQQLGRPVQILMLHSTALTPHRTPPEMAESSSMFDTGCQAPRDQFVSRGPVPKPADQRMPDGRLHSRPLADRGKKRATAVSALPWPLSAERTATLGALGELTVRAADCFRRTVALLPVRRHDWPVGRPGAAPQDTLFGLVGCHGVPAPPCTRFASSSAHRPSSARAA